MPTPSRPGPSAARPAFVWVVKWVAAGAAATVGAAVPVVAVASAVAKIVLVEAVGTGPQKHGCSKVRAEKFGSAVTTHDIQE